MVRPFGREHAPIGIDVGGRFVNAAQLDAGARRKRLVAATSIRRADPAMPFGPGEARHLAQVLDRQGFGGRRAVVAMPPERVMCDLFEPLRDGDLREVLRDEVAKAHRCEPGAIELDWWEIPPLGRPRRSAQVMTVACATGDAAMLLDCFEEAGFEIVGLDVESWAAARSCAARCAGAGALTGILLLSWTIATLVVVGEGVVIYERSLSDSGFNRVTMALASRLGLDEAVTEYVLNEIGFDAARMDGEKESPLLHDARQHLDRWLERIGTELRLSLGYLTQEFPDRPVGEVLLIGEGAGVPAIAPRLSSIVGVKSSVVVPHDVGADAAAGACGAAGSLPRLMTALGLARYLDS